MSKKVTTEEFIKRAKAIHGDKYDYSKTVYVGRHEKLCITCPIHGDFWIEAGAHLSGQGCRECGIKLRGENQQMSKEKFVEMANKVHNNKYDYSKTVYRSRKTKGIIICPIHGEFIQGLGNHLQGHGCPKCTNTHRMNKEEFVEAANKVHNFRYTYDNFVMKNSIEKGLITCPIHGDFLQSPSKHLQGHGCPKCRQSKMEKTIIDYCDKNKIKYEYQFKFSKHERLSYDFCFPEKKILVECQGEQHFRPVNFRYAGHITTAVKNKFKIQLKRDSDKYDNAIRHGYKIVYFVTGTIKKDAAKWDSAVLNDRKYKKLVDSIEDLSECILK